MVGNNDAAEYFGCFDVYIRGVGPILDEDGRYFLFKKKSENRFPTMEEISDKLVALSMIYGSSTNISQAQFQYKRAYLDSHIKVNKYKHGYPGSLTEGGEKEKNTVHEKPVIISI